MERSEETLIPNRESGPSGGPDARSSPRERSALYQKGVLVARVNGPEVDEEARELRMDEVYQSDNLVIPEECEYQDLRIQIQCIQFASKIDTVAPEKGRVLRGVIADILGTREP